MKKTLTTIVAMTILTWSSISISQGELPMPLQSNGLFLQPFESEDEFGPIVHASEALQNAGSLIDFYHQHLDSILDESVWTFLNRLAGNDANEPWPKDDIVNNKATNSEVETFLQGMSIALDLIEQPKPLKDPAGPNNPGLIEQEINDSNLVALRSTQNSVPSAFAGLAGFSVLRTLRLYLAQLEQAHIRKDAPDTELTDRLYKTIFGWEQTIPGKIKVWNYSADDSRGYFFVEDVVVNTYKMRKFRDDEPASLVVTEQVRYDWDIEVYRNGYEAVHKAVDVSKYINDKNISVFNFHGDMGMPVGTGPGRPRIPKYMLNPLDLRSMWARGLNHRLYAYGKNVAVNKVRMTVRTHNESPSSPVYSVETSTHMRGQPDSFHLLEPSDESCVDIMFAGAPPETLGGFPPNQVGWCMGRCELPKAVNSD